MEKETYWTLCPNGCGYNDHVVRDGYLHCGKCGQENYQATDDGKPIYRLYEWQIKAWERRQREREAK